MLGTIGIGATAEPFEDRMPGAAASTVLVLFYAVCFTVLEIALRRASGLASKSQPSPLEVRGDAPRSAVLARKQGTDEPHTTARCSTETSCVLTHPRLALQVLAAEAVSAEGIHSSTSASARKIELIAGAQAGMLFGLSSASARTGMLLSQLLHLRLLTPLGIGLSV